MAYEILQADKVRLKDYVRAFNKAYQDYYTPITINEITLQSLIQRDSIDLGTSIAVLDGDKIVGISMLAARPPRCWIGGVGVIPDYRRQGIARQMIKHLLLCAQQKQFQYVNLEVIDKNEGAFELYQQFGFETKRRLVMMDRACCDVDDILNEKYSILDCEAHEALVFYDRFHDRPNAWQRSRPALLDLSENLQGWLIVQTEDPDHVLGYAVGWMTEKDIHILDLAGDPNEYERELILQTLIHQFHHHVPEAVGHAFNVGDDDVMYRVLRSLDYEEILVQYEMELRL